MIQERKGRLFRRGRSQAIRIPAEFRLDGAEVWVHRDEMTGDVVLSTHHCHGGSHGDVTRRDGLHPPLDDVDAYLYPPED
jgi:hypothetical protein